VIRLAREIGHAGKARHEPGAPGEIVAPAVIAAAQALWVGLARGFNDHLATMSADVGNAAQRAGSVARQQHRLVEAAWKVFARRQSQRRGHVA
jgi:hypothetical protein